MTALALSPARYLSQLLVLATTHSLAVHASSTKARKPFQLLRCAMGTGSERVPLVTWLELPSASCSNRTKLTKPKHGAHGVCGVYGCLIWCKKSCILHTGCHQSAAPGTCRSCTGLPLRSCIHKRSTFLSRPGHTQGCTRHTDPQCEHEPRVARCLFSCVVGMYSGCTVFWQLRSAHVPSAALPVGKFYTSSRSRWSRLVLCSRRQLDHSQRYTTCTGCPWSWQ